MVEVIDEFLPAFILDVNWSSSDSASLGNTLKPKKLQDEPSITLTRPPTPRGVCYTATNVTYTVTVTDPDAPSRHDPKWSEFLHWIATGLVVSDAAGPSCLSRHTLSLTDLKDLVPYHPPGPPKKTGKHRYVFLVFAPENRTTEPLHLTKPEGRKHWGYDYDGERVGVRKWAAENGLVPVGMFKSLFSLQHDAGSIPSLCCLQPSFYRYFAAYCPRISPIPPTDLW